ncbi:flavin-containing monooxygenase [Catelliglobosispora koreensis]|uniref:flavin-containing monooxygenase n=1 Tax=Catelliglobosispora koreensis TaxID=129052 RepID=UPI00035CF60A|nr:NAD(P)/FAD-dependent oxidoreductase [Catelliglobosispora koreensis]
MTYTDVAIIGAGFGGLGAAIRLRQKGFTDFLVFEKADEIGGTWRDNTYPGCACDVPSHLYSFSFALNPNWSDTFSGQQEIWDYLLKTADHQGVRPHVRCGHAITNAAWDEAEQQWVLQTSQGEYRARVLISATGPLSEPSIPDIPGLDSFQGKVFHSARWQHDYDLTGKNVAVVGTGASAIQFVPAIQPKAGHVTVFQRTPAWTMRRMSRRITKAERFVYRHVPGAQRLTRGVLYWTRELMGVGFFHPRVNKFGQKIALATLKKDVKDPVTRAKLTPKYVLGCKRVLLSNDWWPTFSKPNVSLVASAITHIKPDRVVAADGSEHQADTIILGTGFHVTDMPVMHHIRGRDGKTLAERWDPTMRAYLGTTVAGFPNLFFLLGPNTGLGHTSVVIQIESQLNQIIKALKYMRRNKIHAIEPTPDAQLRDSLEVDRKMEGTVWSTGGCQSWYLDATGRNSTLWPGFVTTFRLRLKRFRAKDYSPVGASRELTPAR